MEMSGDIEKSCGKVCGIEEMETYQVNSSRVDGKVVCNRLSDNSCGVVQRIGCLVV